MDKNSLLAGIGVGVLITLLVTLPLISFLLRAHENLLREYGELRDQYNDKVENVERLRRDLNDLVHRYCALKEFFDNATRLLYEKLKGELEVP